LIKLHDKKFEIYLESDVIQSAIKKVAGNIDRHYQNSTPIFIAVLNGAFMFAADLLKNITIPCEIHFVKMSSYEGTTSTGDVKELIGMPKEINGRDLIILEDIVDTGTTIDKIDEILKKHTPQSTKIASLLLKPEAYHNQIKIDYVGMEIPNEFVVGYGLDYDGLGRNYKDIYKIKN